MKWLWRIVKLLFGLLWRLVVLLLFEKWVPFPGQGAEPAAPVAPRAPRKKKRPRDDAKTAQRQAGKPRRAGQVPPPFFAAVSSELSPELAAQREGEHWVRASRSRARKVSVPARKESLAGLLRDRHVLRNAVVLGAALGARRPRS